MRGQIVELGDLERSLDRVTSQAAGNVEGVFGPASAVWQVDREAAVFLGAGRALLMQLAHPWVATAIAEHSTTLTNPVARFHRTFEIMFTLVFGSVDQAVAAATRLHQRHVAITGTMSEALAIHPAGSPYVANDLSALLWVHATLVDTAATAYELVQPARTAAARERYYAECRLLGMLFGIPAEAQPRDWAAFNSYIEQTIASDRLAVGAAARHIGTAVLAGAGRVPVPRWYRDVTASLLPERLRTAYALPFGPREQARAARALRIIRQVYAMLPTRLRYVAPYYEALGRLGGGRAPNFATRSLNRLWIGRPSMASATPNRLTRQKSGEAETRPHSANQ
jgi:uncharacterized protein (DUF2236 family)